MREEKGEGWSWDLINAMRILDGLGSVWIHPRCLFFFNLLGSMDR